MLVVTSTEIIERFKKGERDFSEVKAVGQNFSNMNLNTIIFKNSKFVGCKFNGTNLKNAKFDGCSFEFCEFTDANLIEVNFTDCKIDYTVFQLANLEKSVFTGCELYYIYVWGSNFNSAAKFVKTRLTKIFSVISDATEEDIKKILKALTSSEVPLGLQVEAKGRIAAGKEKYESFLEFTYGKGTKAKSVYEAVPSMYSKTQKSGYVSENPFYALVTAYLSKQQYGKRK